MNWDIFRPSSRLRGDLKARCLKTKMKNSALPGVASQFIAIRGEDPWCQIFLRGKDEKQISPWQKNLLERLFDCRGLAVAIEEGMRDFAAGVGSPGAEWTHLDGESLAEVQKYGLPALIGVREIVIDEVQQEVILNCETEIDGLLTEHGIAIHLVDGRWKYDESSYLLEYEDRVRAESQAKVEENWDIMFPRLSAPAPVETDPTFLIGEWLFDSGASAITLKKLGWQRDDVEMHLAQCEGKKWSFTQEAIEVSVPEMGFNFYAALAGYAREGNRVMIRALASDAAQSPWEGKEQLIVKTFGIVDDFIRLQIPGTLASIELGLVDGCLVDHIGRVMRKLQ